MEEVVRPAIVAHHQRHRAWQKLFACFLAMRKHSSSISTPFLGKEKTLPAWCEVSMVGPQLGRETDAIDESAYCIAPNFRGA